MEETNGNGVKYKLTVESRLTAVEIVLDEIKNNHLFHLEKKMDRIHWLLVVTLASVITTLALKLLT